MRELLSSHRSRFILAQNPTYKNSPLCATRSAPTWSPSAAPAKPVFDSRSLTTPSSGVSPQMIIGGAGPSGTITNLHLADWPCAKVAIRWCLCFVILSLGCEFLAQIVATDRLHAERGKPHNPLTNLTHGRSHPQKFPRAKKVRPLGYLNSYTRQAKPILYIYAWSREAHVTNAHTQHQKHVKRRFTCAPKLRHCRLIIY